MSTSPRVLTFADYYLPGYKAGGPVRTLKNMTERMNTGVRFYIVTRDHDLGDVKPYASVTPGVWQQVGDAFVFYARRKDWTPGALRSLLHNTEHDILYLNSAFSPRTTLAPLLLHRLGLVPSRPIIVAPRGEFAPGALDLPKSALKKRAFLGVARFFGLYKKVIWQASSESERADILRVIGPSAKVCVALDLVPEANFDLETVLARKASKEKNSLDLVFLSRISPMKNLIGALRLLGQMRAPVRLTIYGPIEDEAYWRECRSKIDELPPHVTVTYEGSVPNEQVHDVLSKHHALLLPTLGENFGHVIFEALLAACPVVISDQTPWRDLRAAGIGWDLPLSDEEAFVTVLNNLVRMSAPEFKELQTRAFHYAQRLSTNDEIVRQNLALFEQAATPRARRR